MSSFDKVKWGYKALEFRLNHIECGNYHKQKQKNIVTSNNVEKGLSRKE